MARWFDDIHEADDAHNPEECNLHRECIPYGPKIRRRLQHWWSGLGSEGYLVPEDTQLQRRYADPR